MNSTHVQKNTLVRSVTSQLRQMILRGDVQPGDYLPSRKELASQFGVGVSTVHEAIQALTAVGLVSSHPGKGTWVRLDALDTLIHPAEVESRLGKLDVQEVYEARTVVEVALTELAAERATAADTKQIQQALRAMEDAAQDEQAFVEADLEFHLAVARAGRNQLLEQFYHLSRKLLAEVIAGCVRLPGVKEESIRIQGTIAQAIEERDPHLARKAALDHMAYIERLLEIC
ncbi:MAG: FadR/GntR family transcriptional regulator [Anaerolineae bacterium]|jgi:GntR family transcriptional repressor for pyruvate dehydrogenase complex